MFQVVFSSAGPIRRGELRSLVVHGDEPTSVEIMCFVGHPPEYEPCDECGRFISSPELPKVIQFQASETLQVGDEIHILVTGDQSRTVQRFTIPFCGP